MDKLKRYQEYSGCNTSMDSIAKDDNDGNWVKYEDICVFIFGDDWVKIKEFLKNQ